MPRRGPGGGESIACIGAILAISGGLALWQRTGYWEFSDGVYAESARLILRGLVPYRDFAAAQPPLTYYAPALLLWVHDSVWTLRVALGLLDALTALLTAHATWRLTRSRGLALLAGALAQLLPITLHEHAQAVPETFAAACLLAGCLAGGAGSPRGFRTVLLGVAVMFKFAFIVPALLIAASVTRRVRGVATLLGAVAALIAASILLFGSDLLVQAVRAQWEVGRQSWAAGAGLVAQAGWNELPLLVLAAPVVWPLLRGAAGTEEPCLLIGLTVAAIAELALVATLLKRGSYINVLVVAEPSLLVLAMAGLQSLGRGARISRAVGISAVTLLLGQSGSLLVSPRDPAIARRPFARSGLQVNAAPSAVSRLVDRARACPPRLAYSGDPYFAFLAGRRMPGNQPDVFIIGHAAVDRRFAAHAAADRPQCP